MGDVSFQRRVIFDNPTWDPRCPRTFLGQEVEQLFRLIDADGDGTLDYVELDIVMKTVQAGHGRFT